MANVDAPFGLRAIANVMGKTPAIREYEADAGGSNIFEGSIVVLIAGSGTDNEVVDIFDGTAGAIIGVAVHKRLTADSERLVLVYVDPDQEYEVQVDDGAITHASDLVGSNFGVISATGGDTDTNQSTSELDGSSAAATSTAILVLLGRRLSRDPEQDYTSANPTVVVKIATDQHTFGTRIGVA